MDSQTQMKQIVANAAIKEVKSDMIIGLGSGSTAALMIKSLAGEIRSGKLKNIIKNNRLLLDGSHNEDGSRVLNEYLQTLDCKKHVILGMMANKDHKNTYLISKILPLLQP